MAVSELRLVVREFADPTAWRWELADYSGVVLADHEVRLDASCWQFEAFTDLLGYLSWHAVPDRRDADEARIVAAVGEWIGREVLGPVAAAMHEARPATVRVIVPNEARALLFRPLGLGYADGKPLAVQGVTLVMQPEPGGTAGGYPAVAGGGSGAGPVRDRLRVLGLFSLPEGGQPLNLRRERHDLVRRIRRIAASGRSAEVRVLQYGVTRKALREVLDDGDGWDIIHISGHGAPGELLLEQEDGTPDRVPAHDLAELLGPARGQVRLVTLSACWSAEATAAERRLLLGLPEAAGKGAPAAGTEPGERASDPESGRRDGRAAGRPDVFDSGAVATEIADALKCAVLAMRYPVVDEFAIALSGRLYDLLADKGQPLPQAVGTALREVLADGNTLAGGGNAAWPALSVATPAVFGARAVGMTLRAPAREEPEGFRPAQVKMAGFLPQPDRFVGRTVVMTRASAALAAESGLPGVLLHGMPGGGKTACALELAYTHEHAFDLLVWYKAPDEGMDISGALADFALTLENALPGLRLADLLSDTRRLSAFLPQLTELAERRRMLIVIDNVESLLSADGQWLDERWGLVVAALCGHRGLGRVVLTSRRLPAGTAGANGIVGGDERTGPERLRVLTVDALSADEALLLALGLPHLGRLIAGELPGVDREAARRLALGVLNVAQGHPKLLELADGQASDPVRLAALVEAGGQAWREAGGLPDGFFPGGTGTAGADGAPGRDSAGDYLHVLGAWTEAVAGALTPEERTLFWVLCCLEEPDRESFVLDNIWAPLWRALDMEGQPPELDRTLTGVAAMGLAAVRSAAGDVGGYGVHPGVAAAGRAQGGQEFRAAVDAQAAAFWNAVFRYASGENDDGTVDTGLLVRAGLGAVPYLVRLERWDTAGNLLQRAFIAEPTRANAAAVLPAIGQIAARAPYWADVLARVLEVTDPAAAEHTLRGYLDDAVARGDYGMASVAAGQLMNLYRDSGRLAEALNLAERQAGYTRLAEHGPWTQLAEEVGRLQLLTKMGRAGEVLEKVHGLLRDRLPLLPAVPGPDDGTVNAWNVRETLLDTGRQAARQLGRWQDALDLNVQQDASLRDRAAPAIDIARSRFNNYGPLLVLGRTAEALELLLECRQVFQDARDPEMLGKTLSALANVESARGRGDSAAGMERDALRYEYLAGDVTAATVSYHNLGNYLARHADQPVQALACHLAAALVQTLIGAVPGSQGAEGSLRAAADDLREFGDAATLPADVADLGRLVGDIPGADLPALIAALAPDAGTAEQILRELIAAARQLASAPPADDSSA